MARLYLLTKPYLLMIIWYFKIINLCTAEDAIYKNYQKTSFWGKCYPGQKSSFKSEIHVKSGNIKIWSDAHIFRAYTLLEPRFSLMYDFFCEFTVKDAYGYGVVANIQSMTFESRGSECTDYVKFSSTSTKKNKTYCGIIKKKKPMADWEAFDYFHDDKHFHESENLGFYAKNGELNVKIKLSAKNWYKNLEETLVITFTPVKRVTTVTDPPKTVYSIQPKYMCDGIENCAEDICEDEKECTQSYTFLMLITVFFCLVVIVSIYGCYYFEKKKLCCWHSSLRNDASVSLADLLNDNISTLDMSREQRLPAPTDTPPSYESLFSNQTASSTLPPPSSTTTTSALSTTNAI